MGSAACERLFGNCSWFKTCGPPIERNLVYGIIPVNSATRNILDVSRTHQLAQLDPIFLLIRFGAPVFAEEVITNVILFETETAARKIVFSIDHPSTHQTSFISLS